MLLKFIAEKNEIQNEATKLINYDKTANGVKYSKIMF